MQRESALSSIMTLMDEIDYLLWRLRTYGETLKAEHIEHIRTEIERIQRIII